MITEDSTVVHRRQSLDDAPLDLGEGLLDWPSVVVVSLFTGGLYQRAWGDPEPVADAGRSGVRAAG